ncbi:MAG: hypothetical protein ACLS90_00280 [Clostridia bacterium]
MNILKQKQVNDFIEHSRKKLEDTLILTITLEEFAKILNIPANEQLIVLAFQDLYYNTQLTWYNLQLMYNKKDNNFLVFNYIDKNN